MRSLFRYSLVLIMASLFASCTQESAQTGTNTPASMNTATAAAPITETSPKAGGPTRELDVPYVPTHESIVDAMLTMAEVKGDDILYDLGSGDGRIPITAAKRFRTRGVGIDLNPVRVQEAIANAAKENVQDRVTFKEGDIFEEDFSEATVVTLYLLPEVNLKLKPTILAMKPGTRVVSHNYDMGDWKPEKSKVIKTPDGVDHYVYFWRVPEKR
jgi:hypothetical protein